jgi:hypothetical protein
MQPESTVLPLPIFTFTDKYPQPSLPLKVEEVFQETYGRNLGDVLRDTVQQVSIGDVSQTFSTLTNCIFTFLRHV